MACPIDSDPLHLVDVLEEVTHCRDSGVVTVSSNHQGRLGIDLEDFLRGHGPVAQ